MIPVNYLSAQGPSWYNPINSTLLLSTWPGITPFWFSETFFFKRLFIWLHWVFVVACGILLASLGIFAVAHRSRSCGMWAQLLHGAWDRSSPTKEWTNVPCVARQILNHWPTREVPPEPFNNSTFLHKLLAPAFLIWLAEYPVLCPIKDISPYQGPGSSWSRQICLGDKCCS